MADIFDKCRKFSEGPQAIRGNARRLAAELFSSPSPADNAGPWAGSNGRRILQFSSNDYLGLAMHPEVRAAAAGVVQQYGIGAPMGSRLLTGTTEEHLELERALAQFKRTEAALTFTSGALAMMGTLACLAGPGELLILDEHAHATLVCGAKISRAEIAQFRHNDLAHLEVILRRAAGRPAAVVVDGVYSMQGDTAPLDELVALKERYNVRLIVDDAHGTGVWGEQGRGTAARFGVEDQIDLHLGTFSKALGTAGGFVAGQAAVVSYIQYNAPTFVFTKAMPLAVVAATRKSLELLERADDRRCRLWENRLRLQQELRERGFQIGRTQTPITPIRFAGSEALYFARELRSTFGIWAAPVVYPAVPLGSSILRVIPTAMHSEEDIHLLVDALTRIRASTIVGSLVAV
ncbi:MAG: aminotransferase class I/II-fold pyridoxal phosphate-dependent enzyme [Thermoguttaceae bacterium]